jgi:uncharacterized BrkB/YihY/UPF0761 family membrane protein
LERWIGLSLSGADNRSVCQFVKLVTYHAWDRRPGLSAPGSPVSAFMTLGSLLLVLLFTSTGLYAIGLWLNGIFPGAEVLVRIIRFVVSLALIAVLFVVIYKVLPGYL